MFEFICACCCLPACLLACCWLLCGISLSPFVHDLHRGVIQIYRHEQWAMPSSTNNETWSWSLITSFGFYSNSMCGVIGGRRNFSKRMHDMHVNGRESEKWKMISNEWRRRRPRIMCECTVCGKLYGKRRKCRGIALYLFNIKLTATMTATMAVCVLCSQFSDSNGIIIHLWLDILRYCVESTTCTTSSGERWCWGVSCVWLVRVCK